MKKKLFAVLACTVLVFGLSGCKSKPAGDPTAKDAQGEEPKTEEVASFDYTPAEPVSICLLLRWIKTRTGKP